MKKMFLLSAAAASLVLAGCSTLQSASAVDMNGVKLTAATDVAHINATNQGLYLLWIPLITGSSSNVGGVEFLGENPVSAPAVANLVTQEAKRLGATKTLDMVSTFGSAGFIFYWRFANVSANAAK